MHTTAAVVVTYNRKKLLDECIQALLGQSVQDLDVLVIDNASTDGTFQMVAGYQDTGRILYCNTGANLGGAGGFQYGMREAVERGYRYVWTMDDDCAPTPDALRELLIAAYGLRDDFGYLSSKVLWKDGSLCAMNVQRHPLTRPITDFSAELVPATLASFVSLFIPADVVREVGLPLKEFVIWTDDWEFTRRISLNHDCFVVPGSVVVHKTSTNHGADIAAESADRLKRFDYLYRNDVYLYRREGPRGVVYEAVRLCGHTLRVLGRATDHKAERIRKIWEGTARGLHLDPRVEFPKEGGDRLEPVRVLELTGEPIAFGGQEAMIVELVTHMDLTGLHIDMATPFTCDNPSHRAAIESVGGVVYALGCDFRPGTLKPEVVAPLRTFLQTHRYDVVHIHSGSTTFLAEAALVAKRCGVGAVVVHSHVAPERMDARNLAIRAACSPALDRCADAYCACSREAAEAKFQPPVLPRVHIVRNGVDLGRFAPNADVRRRVRNELGIPEGCLTVGHVGRLVYQKNQTYLLRILAVLAQRVPDVRLLLVGEGPDEPRLIGLARGMGVAEKLLMVGPVSNVQDYLQAMDVFAFPSRFEGLGLACVEAQAAGLPVVASDRVPMAADVAGTVCFLPLGEDVTPWVEAIVARADLPRANNAQAIADSGYAIEGCSADLRGLYLELAGR